MGNQLFLSGPSGISFKFDEHELDGFFNIESGKAQGGVVGKMGVVCSGGWKFTITRIERPEGKNDYWLASDGFDWGNFLAAMQALVSYYLGGFEAAPEEEWLQISRGNQPAWVIPVLHNEL